MTIGAKGPERRPCVSGPVMAGTVAAIVLASPSPWRATAQQEVASRVPWPSAHGGNPPPPPAFLDTTDRRIRDDRPPPTPEKVAALKQLESEVARFTKIGGSYHDTVLSLVHREYVRQRLEKQQRFGEQISIEEAAEDKARLSAIEEFERFVGRYPDDPQYTPDAMFRLGELYFERDTIQQQVEMEAYLEERDRLMDLDQPTDHLVEPAKNFAATIGVYRRLIQMLPEYQRLDGAYYLIGYCLNEMAQPEEARLAWLNLVCGNHFTYRGEALVAEGDEPADDVDASRHPALTLDGTPDPPPTDFEDPYGSCEPAIKDSKFFAETWLRIGEYHFDLDFSEHGLSKAISAYRKVLTRPEDRNYNLALYKVAWAYYRASRYPEAMEHFWKLVQWSDDELKRTGKQGSELREEAIQYLGIGFAYDDWNENQISDPDEGLPRGIERLQSEKLMPQGRPWTSDVYFRLGTIYFDEAKYPQAIEVWKLALSRWPLHKDAPEVQNMIARAHTRHNQTEAAIDARRKLGDYAAGSQWWEANQDHPIEQRQAAQLAEDALINTAINVHQQAQRTRRACVEAQDLALCAAAQGMYGEAAKAYRSYIKGYPNNPQAYELRFNLADALYWSENYEEAAREYAEVRDSNLDDQYLSIAARLVVESVKRLVDQQVEAGALEIRTEPPTPQGSPPRVVPLEMPQLLQRLARARELYLARVDEAHDTEKVRASYTYNNTLLLYVYGYWDIARERFYDIYATRCLGELADETGQVAWLNLRNIAVSLNQTGEVRRLGADLNQRACTFETGGTGTAVAALDCNKPENREKPMCIAGADLTNLRYRDAVDIFSRAQQAKGEEQRLLYEQAATELVEAVNDEPDHPQAPLALEKAAIALERTSRFESAGRLYQRIIDEVGPRRSDSPEEQASLDMILANSYFRLAYNANRFFDFDRAVENYRTLADSKRFASKDDARLVEWREGALINAAKILEYQQQYRRAAEYYQRAAATLKDPAEQRAARYRVAEMAYNLQQWSRTIREMRDFIARYRSDKGAGELVVQAHWRIAEARKALKQAQKDRDSALSAVATAFANSGQEAGSYAAEYAANARFQLVDKGSKAFEKFGIKPGRPATLKAYVETVKKQIEAGAVEAKRRAEAYNVIPSYRRPVWTIGAFVRQGRIYEILARAVLNTPFVVPRDLQKKMKGLPDYAKDDIKIQVEDAIRQLLDQQVRPIECLAVARYALASRAARAGNIDNEYTQEASDRINAYGDERIAECVAQAAQQDTSFEAYRPGEFARAPRGLNLDIEPDVAPPPLSGGTR